MKVLLTCLFFLFSFVMIFFSGTAFSDEIKDRASLKLSSTEFGSYVCDGLDRSDLTDKDVLGAMSRVPRHRFVPKQYAHLAYSDRPLPIDHGQTISQPYIVALMTQLSQAKRGSKVLEIGTGSGYQAAVLAELGAQVFTIEIIPELAAQAETILRKLGYEGVKVRAGDGWKGWPEQAPFDAILVTAAAPRIPEKLAAQLKEGGRMIIPLKQKIFSGETLSIVSKIGGKLKVEDTIPVRFVPMTGGE